MKSWKLNIGRAFLFRAFCVLAIGSTGFALITSIMIVAVHGYCVSISARLPDPFDNSVNPDWMSPERLGDLKASRFAGLKAITAASASVWRFVGFSLVLLGIARAIVPKRWMDADPTDDRSIGRKRSLFRKGFCISSALVVFSLALWAVFNRLVWSEPSVESTIQGALNLGLFELQTTYAETIKQDRLLIAGSLVVSLVYAMGSGWLFATLSKLAKRLRQCDAGRELV